MFKSFSVLFPVLALALPAARAEDPVSLPELTVLGKRLRGDHRSARVYTETELARESGRAIGDVLREAGGVDSLGGTGGNSNLLIRGSSGSQTLVLIDGVKANDPSATNRYFDWSRIDAAQIERVEVLKGPQAVSYGSDAIGGVVLITTKRTPALAGGIGTSASFEAGSSAFARARTALATGVGTFLGGDHEASLQFLGKGVFDGGSSALGTGGTPPEKDDALEAQAGAALKSRWGGGTRSQISADLRAAREKIDAGAFDDDPNSTARNREIRAAANADGRLSPSLAWEGVASHLDFRRAYADFVDSAHAYASDTVLRGTNSRAEFRVRSGEEGALEWTVGAEGARETLAIDSLLSPVRLGRDHAETYSAFAEAGLPIRPGLAFDIGSRFAHFTTYGNQWSEKGGLTYRASEGLTLDAGVSTGFKAPSLYSLYDPTYGNPDLKPEESLQVEAGVAVNAGRNSSLSLRGFQSRIRNRFGYDSATFRSLNVERAEIRGVEFEGDTRVARGLRIAPSLTYLSSRDTRTGRPLADVPRWKGVLKFAYDLDLANSFTFSVTAKSDRGSSAGNARVAGFCRADLTTRHALGPAWTFTTRFENLTDRDYQEIRGYRANGLSAYAGVEFVSL